jgi:hypothetical protein
MARCGLPLAPELCESDPTHDEPYGTACIKHTGFMVNGRLLESDAVRRLAYDSNQIELHFAALLSQPG